MTVGEAAVKAVKLFGSVWRRKVIIKAGTNVTITETTSGEEATLTIAATGGGGGGGAPTSSQYVTLATDATLTAERVLTAGHGVDLVDAGAGSTITVDVDETELDHSAITTGMAWSSSGHTGTASRLAGFSGAGAASYYQIGADVQAWSATLDALAAGTYTMPATKGGTGLTSYSEGDTLYASATNTLAKLAAPTSGQRAGKVLGWSGDTLAWVAPLLVGVIGGRDIIVEARAVYDVPGCTTVERP